MYSSETDGVVSFKGGFFCDLATFAFFIGINDIYQSYSALPAVPVC